MKRFVREPLLSSHGEYNSKPIDKHSSSGWDGWVGKSSVLPFPDIILSDTHLLDLILVYGLRTNVIAVTMKTKKLLKNHPLLSLKLFTKWK